MKHILSIELGCGLIRIGRDWGYRKESIPTDREVRVFLSKAVRAGIRFFDTAPSYGLSEERLGKFLKSVDASIRNSLTIATKCGEHWNEAKQEAYVDHSYEALKNSIDTSIARLGKINILQIHKSSVSVLQSSDVSKAIAYAKSRGVNRFGASVSDIETANALTIHDEFNVAQLPFNVDRLEMKEAIDSLKKHNVFIIVNRPFNMGSIVHDKDSTQSKEELLTKAYRFILQQKFNGVILTGTANSNHLQENISAFQNALQTYEK